MLDIVPYSRLLKIIDSHSNCYKIYTIKDPINNEIFYVGQTLKTLSERLYGHLSSLDYNVAKKERLNNIISKGGYPIINEVESVHAICYIDRYFVSEREGYWIKYYKGIGYNLLNIAEAKSNEFQHYLYDISNNILNPNYYYCGKTVGGNMVFDIKKLIADGFTINWLRCSLGIELGGRCQSDTFQYRRMLHKLQRNSIYDSTFYDEKVFKDTNTDYYDDDY